MGFRSVAALAAVCVLFSASSNAGEQYPNRPIRLVIPLSAGGPPDVIARVIADQMARRLNGTVVVENRPGNGAAVGTRSVATADPDGYTLLFASTTALSIVPFVFHNVDYDPVKSFAPISALSGGAQMVIVRNELPAKSIADLIALARAQPGKLTFGSGNGSARGAAELFKIMAKVDLLGVPYKTQPQVIADLLGDRIDVTFSDFTTGLPPVRGGRARGLAVTSLQRYPGLEEYPTVAESGVPGYESRPWNAAYAPAGTPRPIIDKLNKLIREAVASEAYRNLLQITLAVPFAGSPEELAAWQEEETRKWGEIVRIAGMKEP